MATDLKIELFACNVLQSLWSWTGDLSQKYLVLYEDECEKIENHAEVCDVVFILGVLTRRNLFQGIFQKQLIDVKIQDVQSYLDFYEFFVRTCNRDDLFGTLSIFERMIATMSFVLYMALHFKKIRAFGAEIENYAYIFWTMYFDEFTEEFYEQGGWCRLKEETAYYTNLFEFIGIFEPLNVLLPNYFLCLKESCINYYRFKKVVHYEDKKHKSLEIRTNISKLWSEFQYKKSESYMYLPFSYSSSLNAQKVDLLMKDLKLILDPRNCNFESVKISKNEQQKLDFLDGMFDLEVYSENIEDDDDAQFQELLSEQVSTLANELSEECSISDKLDNQPQNKCSISETQEMTYIISDEIEKSVFSSFAEKKLQAEACIVDSSENSLQQNVSSSENIEFRSETENKTLQSDYDSDNRYKNISYGNEINITKNFSKEKKEDQEKIEGMYKVIPETQMRESECLGKYFVKNQDNSNDLVLRNDNVKTVNESEDAKSEVDIGCSKTNDQKEISQVTDILHTSQLAETDYSKIETSENQDILQDLLSVKEKENIDENKRIREARQVIRNEQKEPKMKNFLRMLLVAGDQSGTKYVISTLSDKEKNENPQETSKKKKKKSKKKKSEQ